MKKLLFTIFALCLLFVNGCSSEEYFITLDKIDSNLANYQGKTLYDVFLIEKERIEYKIFNKPKYDNFCLDSAIILGYMQQFKYILKNLREGLLKIEDVRELVNFLREEAPKFVKKAKSMIITGASFNPKSDFTGKDVLKAPKAAAAVLDAIGNLKKAVEEIPLILEEAGKLLTIMD